MRGRGCRRGRGRGLVQSVRARVCKVEIIRMLNHTPYTQGQLSKWNDTYAELMGESISFLHGSDGSVLPLPHHTQGGEIKLLDLPFVVMIIQSFASQACTLHITPVSAVRHAAHWFRPGMWCVMTNPNRLVLMSSIVQLNGLIRTNEDSSTHVTGLTFVKLYQFTFEELDVKLTASTISFYVAHLVSALDSLQERCMDVNHASIDRFPCPEVEPLRESASWAWSGHNLMQLMTDESMEFQPLHYLGEHDCNLSESEGNAIMEFTYR